jgi:hypothetical protein
MWALVLTHPLSFPRRAAPQADLEAALSGVDALLAGVPADALQATQRRRCRRLLSNAVDFEEMRSLADSPACSAAV